MQNFRPFPLCILWEMPVNPKFGPVLLSQNNAKIIIITRPSNQFWRWPGQSSMQNCRSFPPCVLPEISGNSKFGSLKIVQKLEKSTSHDYKSIISEGGQDKSACKISGHSVLTFSGECLENLDLTLCTKSRCRQNEENQQTVTII